MTPVRPQAVTITLDDGRQVSGLLQTPPKSHACYVLAHGAGAGMSHPFMADVANGLAERGIATLRYQFPYMEQGSKRPDAPKLAQATVRAAVVEASRLVPELPLVAGGKSYGGRMTSQAQAELPLPGVRGLVFLGFPLHPAGRPSDERGSHLFQVRIPMLFLQGSRDALADTARPGASLGQIAHRYGIDRRVLCRQPAPIRLRAGRIGLCPLGSAPTAPRAHRSDRRCRHRYAGARG